MLEHDSGAEHEDVSTGTTPDDILRLVRSRLNSPGLLNGHPQTIVSQLFATEFEQSYQELLTLISAFARSIQDPPRILLADPDPIRFLAKFMAACATGCLVFLANPNWIDSEWQYVNALVQPNLQWVPRPAVTAQANSRSDVSRFSNAEGHITTHPIRSGMLHVSKMPQAEHPNAYSDATRPINQTPAATLREQLPTIMIPTGGSSGNIRFAIHTWDTLMASVRGFQQHFQTDVVNACCVLPLYHVSGLMQFLRCFTSGGCLVVQPFTSLEAGLLLLDPTDYFLSLVPTQLARLCQQSLLMDYLKGYKAILLGGAPAWPELLDTARLHQLPIAPTYGMTETASQIATLHPADFLAGHSHAGPVLPHARITIRDCTGTPLPNNQTGLITVQAESLALGYHPELDLSGTADTGFQSQDLGFLDDNGQLHVVGRQDDVIISGGENIFPAEVEAAIRATGLVEDVAVIGVSDRHWGQAVTAIYVPCRSQAADVEVTPNHLKSALSGALNPIKHPKHWLAVPELPRNAQGKLKRSQLHEMAQNNGLLPPNL